ncbi:MAG: c-type cytochrome [Acidobacteriota bacterium]
MRKIIAYSLVLLIVLAAVGISMTIGWRPFIGPKTRALTNRTFVANPPRLERGQYLAEKVMGCFYCHSERDWKAPGAPPMTGRKGAGAAFPGGPGKLFAPNITSDRETGVGAWTDDMLARAIREGVDKNGKTLFPIMPYQNYSNLSDEDLGSLVVYLRTIPPVKNAVPESEIIFPVNRLINAVPQPITTEIAVRDLSNPIDRGEYLTTQASCADCHTPRVQGRPIPGLAFAGGFAFNEPIGPVVSANITPDPSGISFYDENMFVTMMRTGQVGARKLNPTMPFSGYGGMTDEDLKAILAYLRTLTPVSHRVDNTEPPTPCKLCKVSHGLGDRN